MDFWVDTRKSLSKHEAWMHSNLPAGQAVTKLTDDFLHTTAESVSFTGGFFEGGGLFEYQNRWYMMAGTPCCLCDTGASAKVWMAPAPLGPWTEVADLIAPVSPTTDVS